jgi:serine/threonine protein kinase
VSNTVSVTRASRYGKFRPYSLRATGGFSDVYLARDNTGRTAALKVFRTLSNDSTNSMERFRREKTILERVGSRRVARLIDADLDATPPWIASEFINGPTLREAVNQSGPVDIRFASSVLSLLAETLDELHELGVAHRDLNPNNVVLSDEGPTLIDFGSAQQLATGQASYSKLSVGTPGYISPEQLNGDPATLSSDIYAFGKMAIYLVTGDSTEHTGKGLAKFGDTQRNVLVKCLSVDPLERPTSRELRNVFASEIDAVESLRKFNYSMPDLKRLPRSPLVRWLLTITVLASALGALGIWRATTTDQLTTDSVIQRINNDQQRVGGTVDGLKVRSGNFGAFDAISLPTEFGIDRQRRNFGESEFGFLEIFKVFVPRGNEEVNISDLVVYTLPSSQPP